MANLNYIIEFSFCTKCCTYVWENVNLNTEIHCHFTYCIAILHITLQIEFCYTYASMYNTVSHVYYFYILGGVKFTYVVSTTRCIYTCPVSSGMRPRPPPEVVREIGFILQNA